MRLLFDDGTSFVEDPGYDTFFLGFNHDFFLRESCYRCTYCGTNRVADVTMADFWGCPVDSVPPGQLRRGVSLVLLNGERGMRLLEALQSSMELEPIGDSSLPMRHNLALVRPQPRPEVRDGFFTQMDEKGYDRAVRAQFRARFMKLRVKNLLRRILPRAVLVKIMKNV